MSQTPVYDYAIPVRRISFWGFVPVMIAIVVGIRVIHWAGWPDPVAVLVMIPAIWSTQIIRGRYAASRIRVALAGAAQDSAASTPDTVRAAVDTLRPFAAVDLHGSLLRRSRTGSLCEVALRLAKVDAGAIVRVASPDEPLGPVPPPLDMPFEPTPLAERDATFQNLADERPTDFVSTSPPRGTPLAAPR